MAAVSEHTVEQALDYVRERNPLRPINPVRRGGIKQNLVSQLVQTLGVPAVVAGWLLYKFVWVRRGKNKTPAAQPSAAADSSAKQQQAIVRSKPRRGYKVKRDHAADEAERQATRAAALQAVQQLANQAEEDNDEGEEEEGEEGAAAGGPGGQGQFIQMLQSLGYKLVMPSDGSNQVYLVPPEGAPGQEEQQHQQHQPSKQQDQPWKQQDGSQPADMQQAVTPKSQDLWEQARSYISSNAAAIAAQEHGDGAGQDTGHYISYGNGVGPTNGRYTNNGDDSDEEEGEDEWEEGDELDLDFDYDLDAGGMGAYMGGQAGAAQLSDQGGYLPPRHIHGPVPNLPDLGEFDDEDYEDYEEGDFGEMLGGGPPAPLMPGMFGGARDGFDQALDDEISEHLMNELMREMMAEGPHPPDYFLEGDGEDMYIEEGDEEGYDEDEDA